MTINDNSTKSINAAIIDLQNQIKQLQHKIGILSKNQLKEDDIEFPGKVEYADEAGKAKEADHAKTADTAKYTSETENAVHAGYADIATKATQDGSGNVITDTYATKTELTSGLSGKANTSHNHSAADITSGTLAVERGGTGQTTQADINKAFVGELPEGNDVVTDGTMFVSSWASDNGFADTNATNVPYKRKFSHVWEYIKGKISSVLGITNNKHIIKGETVDTNTYEDVNPKLVFSNSDGSQNASLTFTDYDAIQAPASVTLNGNQGGEYFIAPNIKATGKFYGSLDGTADKATNVNLSKTLDTVNGDKLQIGNGTAQNVTNAKHAATADAFSTTYISYISPAEAAAMKDASTIWPLSYDKNYLQTVTVTWEDYSSHTFPAGASGMFFPGYGSNGGTLILINFYSNRMLYNVWIDSNRWSGWHYIDMPYISYT